MEAPAAEETKTQSSVGPEASDSIPKPAPNPNISQTTRPPGQRICDYYLTKRGCSKGDRCDFLHEGGSVNPSVENLPADAPQVCSFFLSERGCVKAERCDFAHPVAPNGTQTRRICEYFQTSRGCVKAERCDFLHVRKPDKQGGLLGAPPGSADFDPSAGGGSLMDAALRAQAHANQLAAAAGMIPAYPGYTNQNGYGAVPAQSSVTGSMPNGQMPPGPGGRPAMATAGTAAGSTRVCDFYQTARGCAKQERCDFIHAGPNTPTDGASVYAQKAAQTATASQQAVQQPDAATAAYYASYGYSYGADGTVIAAPVPQQSYYAYAADGTVVQTAMPAMQPVMQPVQQQYAYAMPAAMPPATAGAGSGKVCSFWGTGRGCRKGARCDFVHPADTAAVGTAPAVGGAPAAAAGLPPSPVAAAKPSVRYSPY